MTHAAPQTPGSGFRSTFAVRHTWPRFKGGRGYKVRSAEFSIKWILSLTISNVRRSQKKEQINTGLPVVFNTDLQIIPNREKLLPPSLDPTSVSVTPPRAEIPPGFFPPYSGSFPCKIIPTAPSSGRA